MDLSTLYCMAEAAPKVVDEKGYSYVWAVVFTGLSVVFLALIILILFVWIMGKFFTAIENRKNSIAPAELKTAPVKASAAVKPAAVNNSDDEVIAVISAAIAALGQAEGKNYKLKSVKPVRNKTSRSAWSMAGLQSDTMPF